MSDSDNNKNPIESAVLQTGSASPLVFISHDARDAELAEALSKLLKSVSAGMIKTFRSSDKKGTEGIDFGDEWYRRLMEQLQCTSDVVCLFTERSIDRPWILFEAGVAKGKLNTPVIGLALGIPMSRVTTGPFYQFMNMDDTEGDLTKLVVQLARRVPGLELDSDVIRAQVSAFKTTESAILGKLASGPPKPQTKLAEEENAVAKLAEELKALPSRVAETLGQAGGEPRRKRNRRIPARIVEELVFRMNDNRDPFGIVMAASLFRDDVPWMYELGLEVYKAVKRVGPEGADSLPRRLDDVMRVMRHVSVFEDFGDREIQLVAVEFGRMLRHVLAQATDLKRHHSTSRTRTGTEQSVTEPET